MSRVSERGSVKELARRILREVKARDHVSALHDVDIFWLATLTGIESDNSTYAEDKEVSGCTDPDDATHGRHLRRWVRLATDLLPDTAHSVLAKECCCIVEGELRLDGGAVQALRRRWYLDVLQPAHRRAVRDGDARLKEVFECWQSLIETFVVPTYPAEYVVRSLLRAASRKQKRHLVERYLKFLDRVHGAKMVHLSPLDSTHCDEDMARLRNERDKGAFIYRKVAEYYRPAEMTPSGVKTPSRRADCGTLMFFGDDGWRLDYDRVVDWIGDELKRLEGVEAKVSLDAPASRAGVESSPSVGSVLPDLSAQRPEDGARDVEVLRQVRTLREAFVGLRAPTEILDAVQSHNDPSRFARDLTGMRRLGELLKQRRHEPALRAELLYQFFRRDKRVYTRQAIAQDFPGVTDRQMERQRGWAAELLNTLDSARAG